MNASFKVGDLVWAKMKGYPPWPAEIFETPGSNAKFKKKYFVYFFGCHAYGWIFPHDLQHHNESLLKRYRSMKRYPPNYERAVEAIVDADRDRGYEADYEDADYTSANHTGQRGEVMSDSDDSRSVASNNSGRMLDEANLATVRDVRIRLNRLSPETISRYCMPKRKGGADGVNEKISALESPSKKQRILLKINLKALKGSIDENKQSSCPTKMNSNASAVHNHQSKPPSTESSRLKKLEKLKKKGLKKSAKKSSIKKRSASRMDIVNNPYLRLSKNFFKRPRVKTHPNGPGIHEYTCPETNLDATNREEERSKPVFHGRFGLNNKNSELYKSSIGGEFPEFPSCSSYVKQSVHKVYAATCNAPLSIVRDEISDACSLKEPNDATSSPAVSAVEKKIEPASSFMNDEFNDVESQPASAIGTEEIILRKDSESDFEAIEGLKEGEFINHVSDSEPELNKEIVKPLGDPLNLLKFIPPSNPDSDPSVGSHVSESEVEFEEEIVKKPLSTLVKPLSDPHDLLEYMSPSGGVPPEEPFVDFTVVVPKLARIIATDKKLGFIGLGRMGQRIVRNLINSQHLLTIWNRDSTLCIPFVGAKICETPAEMMKSCDIIFCCLSDSDASKEVFYMKDGILEGLRACDIKSRECKGFVELTSLNSDTALAFYSSLNKEGCRFLEAPLSGSKKDADTGNLSIIAGGDRSLFDDCFSFFQAISKDAKYAGNIAGQASNYSILKNSISASFYTVVGEILALAEKINLDKKMLLSILDGENLLSYASFSFYNHSQDSAELEEKCLPVNTPLHFMSSSLKETLNLGSHVNYPMSVNAAANEIYKISKKRFANHDVSAIFQVLREKGASQDQSKSSDSENPFCFHDHCQLHAYSVE